ncbi:hypothetical protein [uncultured Gordonia sp.]|uniref:hypothetical protein n=1 Tax=uncultured Gordonia sp. TaxID=198437 RepID=UPI00261E4887|nr:hypothetical protein [uncultured Gordonia sp.]
MSTVLIGSGGITIGVGETAVTSTLVGSQTRIEVASPDSPTHTGILVPTPGRPGADGRSVEVGGSRPTYAELPDDLGAEDAGVAWIAGGLLYRWDGAAWDAEEDGVPFQGPEGPAGPATSLTIGTVDEGAADASITGTAPTQVLNLTLPKGNPGDAGPPNSLSIGTVSEGAAAASITGTAPTQVLNLTLPKGNPGDDGVDGLSVTSGSGAPSGTPPEGTLYVDLATGDVHRYEAPWDVIGNIKGPEGDTGPANSLTIGTVGEGAADASITGTAPTQTLNLTLPKGDKGDTGSGLGIDDVVPTYAELPDDLGPGDAGYVVRVEADDQLYVWNGSSWPAEGTGMEIAAATSWNDLDDKPATFPPSAHTHAIADTTGLQAALDAKTATSRTITAGAGLTGGGDLSADRSLAADFGSAAGKICQGNDTRLSDARTPVDGSVTTTKIAAATLVTAAETIAANNNDTTIPTSAAVKAYADAFDGGLADIVEDTTPQLGGNLDLNGHTVGDATAADLTKLHGAGTLTGNNTGDQDLSGLAPTSRTITAGTGLTGGGNLTANRTLAADFGSGAGKVCQGNDSRLSDARTPTAHTHAIADTTGLQGALDGKASSSHTHAAGDTTSGTFDDARIPNLAASKITSGTLDAARIPDLAASKITSGTLDAARIPAITSSMITDGTIVNADVNASAGIVGSKLADASVMLVKLGSDVGPAMQSMIDASIATAQTVAIRTVSGTTDTLVLTDQSKAIECTSGSATTITIPPNSSVAFPVGSVIEVAQCGAGQVTLAPGGGVTLSNRNGLKTAGQWATLTLRKRATDGWIVGGDAAS